MELLLRKSATIKKQSPEEPLKPTPLPTRFQHFSEEHPSLSKMTQDLWDLRCNKSPKAAPLQFRQLKNEYCNLPIEIYELVFHIYCETGSLQLSDDLLKGNFTL